MKKLLFVFALSLCFSAAAQSLVLLHTNDSHSNIDSDENGKGGILPRKAIIDSVRKAEKNVMLIDAGDMVQGTLYFNFFKGDVEYPLFNMMDYDIRILGNHEFDNGIDELARHWKNVKGKRLATNYDFSKTPAAGLFDPYYIKTIEGKKVGFFAINIDPTSLISESNYAGMVYKDAIETANATAAMLRKKGCKLVVAVTHIGYKVNNGKADDLTLARLSKDIDIIIGGHSHTFVDPSTPDETPYWIKNAVGKDVLVAQTGKYGANVGYIKLDLSNFANRNIDYEYIPVTDRFSPDAYSREIKDFLAPYKHVVDSVNARVIGYSLQDMSNSDRVGAYPNWVADFAAQFGRQIADSLRAAGVQVPAVDLGIMNVGGTRQPMKKGVVTEGRMLSTFPFVNYMQLVEVSGQDLIDTMKAVSLKGGESVSSEVRVVTDDDGNFKNMYINGREVDPNAKYIVATNSYITEGNDDMVPMRRHRELWRDKRDVAARVIDYVQDLASKGIPITSDQSPRFVKDFHSNLK